MDPKMTLTTYQVELPLFEGPLDLLLKLIEREQMDITKISLAQVTDQYLAHLEELKDADPDELTDFLVIAAKLILIKSQALLPQPPIIEEEEEDVGDELIRQLIAYRQFKQIADYLGRLAEKGERNFIRLTPPIKIEPRLEPGGGDLNKLLLAAQAVFSLKPPEPEVSQVVSAVRVTVGQQMARIRQALSRRESVSFYQLLSQDFYWMEVVVTFLAVLELIKRRVIAVDQPDRFGEIYLHQNTDAPELSDAEWEELAQLTEVS